MGEDSVHEAYGNMHILSTAVGSPFTVLSWSVKAWCVSFFQGCFGFTWEFLCWTLLPHRIATEDFVCGPPGRFISLPLAWVYRPCNEVPVASEVGEVCSSLSSLLVLAFAVLLRVCRTSLATVLGIIAPLCPL